MVQEKTGQKLESERQVPFWLGLGSNSEDALLRLEKARKALQEIPGLTLFKASPVYKTEPQDYLDQPFFHNQALEMRAASSWQPVPLMKKLLEVEAGLGRVRSQDPALRFGPRAIDIDMLLFGEGGAFSSSDPVCLLPHPRLVRRAFWLVPLRDTSPDLRIQGEDLGALLARLCWRLQDSVIYQEAPGQD